MGDFLLVVLLGAVFAFGWFLVGKVDAFLDEDRQARTGLSGTGGEALRIGFADPLAAYSLSAALEQYSDIYPEVSIRLFQGDGEALLRKMALHKLNIVILPEKVAIPADKDYNRKKVRLALSTVGMKYGGLDIEPIAEGSGSQNAVWAEESNAAAVKSFIKYLEAG